MDVVFRNFRQIKIVDMGDGRNIDAARRNIGRNENTYLTRFESFQRPVALSLTFVAVDGCGCKTMGDQHLHQFFRPVLGPGKNQRQIILPLCQHGFQQIGLAFGMDEIDTLTHLVCRFAGGRDFNSFRVIQIGL